MDLVSHVCCWVLTSGGNWNSLVVLHNMGVLADGIVWRKVADICASRSRSNHIFPLLSNSPKTRQEVRDFSIWSSNMVRLLRQLISGLSDTVGAWGEFQRKEIGYFLIDGESPSAPSPPSLRSSVAAVDKAFSFLKVLLRKLRDLEKQLCEDNPQGVSHLSSSEFKGELHPSAVEANKNSLMLS